MIYLVSFDLRKNTLYCENENSDLVKSTKTVMSIIFNCLIRWTSPIFHLQLKKPGNMEMKSSMQNLVPFIEKIRIPNSG